MRPAWAAAVGVAALLAGAAEPARAQPPPASPASSPPSTLPVPPEGALSVPASPPPLASGPPAAPVEPTQDAALYAPRPEPECLDFERAPGGGWRALASVRFPGPQGEVRIPAGEVAAPGGYVGGLDFSAILQARCF